MESSREIDVTSLDAAHRQALEDVIGTQLQANQRLIINVTDASAESSTAAARPAQSLEDWTNVYDGLSDEEIDEIDKIVKTRAKLTRDLP
jgi:uncharacterized protein YbaP (TraB family)